MSDLKKCKGLHKLTYGYGCNHMVDNQNNNRKFGLGKSCGCFQKWIKTDNGQVFLNKQFLPKYKIKENDFNYKKEIKKRSNQNYRTNVLQPLINEIVKLIDKDHGCIVKGAHYKNVDAGHFYSVGSNETLSLNLHNIFSQSTHSNRSRGGEPIEYLQGLQKTFGYDYSNFVTGLSKCPVLRLTIDELKNTSKICRSVIKELKNLKEKQTLKQRVMLRNKYNLMLNIYKLEYSYYKIK